MERYLPRVCDSELRRLLSSVGAVLIEGPKWCGKTTTGMMQSASVLSLQDIDQRQHYESVVNMKPSLLLEGPTPRLLDEWQEFPILWDGVRQAVDRRGKPGQFILTGSNTINSEEIRHSGLGRIARMRMAPMSLFESQESSGAISLRSLFDEPGMDITSAHERLELEQLVFVCCRGGWPAAVLANTQEQQLEVVRQFFNSLCEVELSTVDGSRRNPTLARAILWSWARNVSTLARSAKLMSDVRAFEEACAESTFYDYVGALRRLFIINDLEPWSPAIRSSSAIKRGVKREVCDPSIAAAALGLKPPLLMDDLPTFGFLFETLAIRDLRVYSQALGGQLSYYHDRYDLEADAVLHLNDGRYALIEFKLGARQYDEAAKHLLEIQALVQKAIDEGNTALRPPTLLLIVTLGEYSYTRDDGVKVVPLSALRD